MYGFFSLFFYLFHTLSVCTFALCVSSFVYRWNTLHRVTSAHDSTRLEIQMCLRTHREFCMGKMFRRGIDETFVVLFYRTECSWFNHWLPLTESLTLSLLLLLYIVVPCNYHDLLNPIYVINHFHFNKHFKIHKIQFIYFFVYIIIFLL